MFQSLEEDIVVKKVINLSSSKFKANTLYLKQVTLNSRPCFFLISLCLQ